MVVDAVERIVRIKAVEVGGNLPTDGGTHARKYPNNVLKGNHGRLKRILG